jgi:predicted phage terminase large subunit-like protein
MISEALDSLLGPSIDRLIGQCLNTTRVHRPYVMPVPRTYADASEQLTRIKATLARRHFRDFFKQAFANVIEPDTPLDDSWVIDALCDHVQWVFEEWAKGRRDYAYRQAVQNILFNIPPRCLKSKIISVAAVAWAWLRWPHMTFITLSANPRVAQDNAEDCLKLVQSSWYRSTFSPEWSVDVDRSAVSNYALSKPDPRMPDGPRVRLGWRKSRGWDTKITGEGADCLMPDDPHDAEEAQGKVKRDAVLRKWDSSIRNRVRDRRTSIRIGIMQRLHEADWTGHVLAKMNQRGAVRWCHVRIPLEYNAKKPTLTGMPVNDNNRYDPEGVKTWADPRTVDGQIMDPVRFTPEVCAYERVEMGPYGFAAQMNQDPTPPDGGQFQRRFWRWFTYAGAPSNGLPRPDKCSTLPVRTLEIGARWQLPRFDWICLTVDATFGDTEKADNVGMLVVAGIKADRFILHDATKKMGIQECMDTMKALIKAYHCTITLLEKKANGQAVCDLMLSEIGSIVLVDPEGGKDSRAHSNVPMIAAGNLYLLEGCGWAHDVIEEHAAFPKGSHDDRVDALSQCLTYYRDPETAMALASCRW